MIKISKLADYAVVVLASLAQSDEPQMNAGSLSAKTSMPEPTVAKVLKLLAKAEILNSTRGAGGGYSLAREPAKITIADIIVSVDGPIALTACVDAQKESCCYEAICPVHGRWDGVNMAVREALENVSLADMIKTENKLITGGKLRGANEQHI